MKKLDLFWWNWQHARNLREIWIFEGFDPNIIDIGDPVPEKSWCSAVIVWIAETRQVITKLIWHDSEVINCSWVMSTNPPGIDDCKFFSNFHFLFWSNISQDLRVAFSWDLSENTEQIIRNSRKLWIEIIETDIETHDSIMAIIQALGNLFIILTWLSNNDNKNELIKPWKSPNNTIADMIFENIYFENVLIYLLKELQEWTDLSELFLDMVWTNIYDRDIKLFWTPNFDRVFNFARGNRVIVNDEIINLCANLFQSKAQVLAKIDELKNPNGL